MICDLLDRERERLRNLPDRMLFLELMRMDTVAIPVVTKDGSTILQHLPESIEDMEESLEEFYCGESDDDIDENEDEES